MHSSALKMCVFCHVSKNNNNNNKQTTIVLLVKRLGLNAKLTTFLLYATFPFVPSGSKSVKIHPTYTHTHTYTQVT